MHLSNCSFFSSSCVFFYYRCVSFLFFLYIYLHLIILSFFHGLCSILISSTLIWLCFGCHKTFFFAVVLGCFFIYCFCVYVICFVIHPRKKKTKQKTTVFSPFGLHLMVFVYMCVCLSILWIIISTDLFLSFHLCNAIECACPYCTVAM